MQIIALTTTVSCSEQNAAPCALRSMPKIKTVPSSTNITGQHIGHVGKGSRYMRHHPAQNVTLERILSTCNARDPSYK